MSLSKSFSSEDGEGSVTPVKIKQEPYKWNPDFQSDYAGLDNNSCYAQDDRLSTKEKFVRRMSLVQRRCRVITTFLYRINCFKEP